MNKPHIICHMVMSVNGKVTGSFLENEQYSELLNKYFDIHKEFEADAFMCGRTTFESSFPQLTAPTTYDGSRIERVDFVGEKADFYAVAIDTKGKLVWEQNHLVDEDEGYNGARIIEVLTENVSDSFLAHLREKNISYIFAGQEILDVKLAVQKLYELFGIERLLLEGGGIINGSFLEADMIDELSLVVVPAIETSSDAVLLFETGRYGNDALEGTNFQEKEVHRLQDGGLWLQFLKNK